MYLLKFRREFCPPRCIEFFKMIKNFDLDVWGSSSPIMSWRINRQGGDTSFLSTLASHKCRTSTIENGGDLKFFKQNFGFSLRFLHIWNFISKRKSI